jgi:ribosome-binding protein aMBF1 (putative translation factor)
MILSAIKPRMEAQRMKNDIDAHIGKRLRSRRTMLGLTQNDLAKALGIMPRLNLCSC